MGLTIRYHDNTGNKLPAYWQLPYGVKTCDEFIFWSQIKIPLVRSSEFIIFLLIH